MIKNKLHTYQYFIFLFLISLVIYVLGVVRVKSIFWGDSLYYYSYTRSIVMDNDINFLNQAFHPWLGFPNQVEFSQITSLVTNKFSPGTALFWIPGFVLGQGVSYFGNWINSLFGGSEFFLVDGAGVLPQYFVAVSSVFFSVLGLWFLFKLLKDWFGKQIAALTALTLFLTTQIFYYTTMDPVNSHSVSFLLSSLLLYQLSKVLKTKPTWMNVIPMGVTAGLLVLVRNQDVVVVFPVLVALLFSKKESLINKLNWFTLYCGSAFIIFSAQIYTTLHLFGVLGSPYVMRGEKFNWFKPDIFRVLFTLENGLFFFAPILLIAVIFLFKYIFDKYANPLLILVLVSIFSFLLQLYVVASWGEEIIGGPYGTRMFISVLPHLSLGIAFFINYIKVKLEAKKFKYLYFSLLALLFTNIMLQTFWMLYRF